MASPKRIQAFFCVSIASLLTSGVASAVPITVNNNFFDNPPTTSYTGSGIPDWPLTFSTAAQATGVQVGGQTNQLAGHQEAYINTFTIFPTDTTAISQDVGALLPNTTYTLTVGVGGHPSGYGSPDTGAIELVNGTDANGTVLASTPEIVGPPIFTDSTATFTTGPTVSGDLTIVLLGHGSPTGNGAGQIDFQNVRLDAIPEPATAGLLILGFAGLIGRRNRH